MSDGTAPAGTLSPHTPDQIVASIASRQHGLVTYVQLVAAGLSHKAIRHRVREGRLHRLSRGVYAVGYRRLSLQGRRLAVALACGPDAGVSHLHAASLHKASRFACPARIDVVAPTDRRPSLPARVHRSRTLVPADLTTVDGIPVTRPARTFVDLTECLTKFQLANVLHRAAYRGLLVLPLVDDAIARANGRKVSVLQQALALHRSGSAGTRSTAEDTFLRRIQLPEPLVNTALVGEEVDFHWPDKRLVVEIDGPHHGRPASASDDARKDAKLREAGYTVLRVSDRDVQSGHACYDLICFTYAS